MKQRRLGIFILLSLASLSKAHAAETPGTLDAAQQDLIGEYCLSCHNFEDWSGGLAFDAIYLEDIAAHAETWERVVKKLRGRLMPPPGNPQPESAEIAAFVHATETLLDQGAANSLVPGHMAMRRLNRSEYENEIRRILALDVNAEEFLPPDTRSEGFDNNAAVQQVSPSFFEQFVSAARAISINAVGNPASAPEEAVYTAPDQKMQNVHVRGLPLGTRGGFVVDHYFPSDGEYVFSINLGSTGGSLLRSYPTGWVEYEHEVVLTLDGKEVFRQKLGGPEDLEAVDKRTQLGVDEILNRFKNIRIATTGGPKKIGIAFKAKTLAESDRNLKHLIPGSTMDSIPIVYSASVMGPFNPAGIGTTPNREKVFSCYPQAANQELPCASEIVSRLGREAFRRPLTDADLQTLMGFYQSGAETGGFETGIQRAVMAMLSSPKFLYRVEEVPSDLRAGDVYQVSDVELATRLSFFIWNQGPDDELLLVAESGKLREGNNLEMQVKRMLEDERSIGLVDNFAMQWLKVEDIEAISPDPRLHPDFDETLKLAMKEELRLFVDSILREDRSVPDLLSASHTYVNERLARHYGLANIRGSQFQRVELDNSHNWGLLGKAGILLLTSYPNRTSPVLRGAYILDAILGVPPAAPPPEVETDLEDAPGSIPTTVRERLEAHRANPSCNQCHGVIDPLGLALENFNVVGQWNTKDRWAGRMIDATGMLVGGEPLSGPDDLREALMTRQTLFMQSFTEKLFTYALGRTLSHHDMPTVRSILSDSEKDAYRFSTLVMNIVESAAFQMNTVLPDEPALETLPVAAQ